MASFDIVSKVDLQRLDNAINVAVREITTRYDFHDSKSEIALDKKTMMIHIVTENDMRMKAIEGVIISRMMKQSLDSSCLDFGKELYAAGNMVKKDIKVKQGVDKDTARKIVKLIKDTGLKVQASIMDEQVRVTGKKLDDLQSVQALLNGQQLGLPVQYDNYRN
jgi:uncharacterized protein YajQ (UPF0234 family)